MPEVAEIEVSERDVVSIFFDKAYFRHTDMSEANAASTNSPKRNIINKKLQVLFFIKGLFYLI